MKQSSDGFLMLRPENFPADFAGDVPLNLAKFMAISQVAIAAAAPKEPVKTCAWKTKPTFAVVSGSDHMINPKSERWMAQRAHAKMTEVPTSSHAVYLSHPDTVADVIEDAAKTIPEPHRRVGI